jgi:hypothetical protein
MPLLPRDQGFYPLFGAQVAIVAEGARELEAMLRDFTDLKARSARIRVLEHDGDDVNHRIHHHLEAVFVTPFGREEIHALAEELDDVIDHTEEAADLVVLYGLAAPPVGAADQAAILVRQTAVLAEAIAVLPSRSHLGRFAVELHRLEKEGDQLLRHLTQAVFDGATDVRPVITALDIHRMIESAIDDADHVGQVLERVSLQVIERW